MHLSNKMLELFSILYVLEKCIDQLTSHQSNYAENVVCKADIFSQNGCTGKYAEKLLKQLIMLQLDEQLQLNSPILFIYILDTYKKCGLICGEQLEKESWENKWYLSESKNFSVYFTIKKITDQLQDCQKHIWKF